MVVDPVRLADTLAWLEKAANDLRGAQIDLEAEPPLVEDILFHSQQAVEKSLKAFLTWHDRPFRRTHSLEELGEACLELDGSLRELVDEAAPLTEFAWAYRYPGVVAPPSREEGEEALELAQRVYEAIVRRLPAEARLE